MKDAEILKQIKLEWGVWFIDWLYIADIDAYMFWERAYREHPLYRNVVKQWGEEPSFTELIEAYVADDFTERYPFKVLYRLWQFGNSLSDLIQQNVFRCEVFIAKRTKLDSVYDLPWHR